LAAWTSFKARSVRFCCRWIWTIKATLEATGNVSALQCCESAAGVNSRLKATLVLRQQCESLLTVILCLQHCTANELHSSIIRVVLGEILSELQGGVGLARSLQGQRLDGGEIGGVLFAGDGGQDLVGLALGNLGAQLKHTSRELVLGGEGGGVEVDYALVLACVEGIVDVEELWERKMSELEM
jgi:hypothetical protein